MSVTSEDLQAERMEGESVPLKPLVFILDTDVSANRRDLCKSPLLTALISLLSLLVPSFPPSDHKL